MVCFRYIIVNTLHKGDKNDGDDDDDDDDDNNNSNKMYGMHHSTADIDRLYVKRKEGGTDVLQTDATNKAEIINIAQYLNTKHAKD